MTEKDNSKLSRITIRGQVAAEISVAGLTRRIYHYHVNINHPQHKRPRDYERDIHICEQQQDMTETDSPPGRPTPSPQTSRPAQADADVLSGIADKPANEYPQHEPALTDLPGQDTTPEIAGDIQTEQTPAAPKATFSKAVVNIPSIKPLLTRIKNGLGRLTHTASTFSPGIRKRNITSSLKPPPARNIFTARTRNYISKTSLLLVSVLIAVSLFYFLSRHPETTTAVKHEPETEALPESADKNHQYHAKIEQHSNGVTITIRGPDHEEVLTRLPPGYHPIVQDNKIVHVVTPGNTLWFIAKRYIKDPYRYPELARLNKIKNPDLIYPGERVVIQYIRKP